MPNTRRPSAPLATSPGCIDELFDSLFLVIGRGVSLMSLLARSAEPLRDAARTRPTTPSRSNENADLAGGYGGAGAVTTRRQIKGTAGLERPSRSIGRSTKRTRQQSRNDLPG